ncbi:hypothetical protein R1sor_021303 [Riccia sorocarpa]|uniref:Uncharacterized protein n=1 Tax=Riccia sorocarpa TaxID=122646 RepID=A0ABD3GGP1_9MARC
MTTISTVLTFDSLVKKIRTKLSISSAWFVTQNVADAALYLWRFNGDEPIPLGVILKTVSNTNNTIELLARKKEGGFVRYELQVKYMDRKQSKLALGAGLLSADNNQIYRLLEKAMHSTENYKLLERETIKEVLRAAFFGVMAQPPSHYLPHTELVQKARGSQGVHVAEEDDVDEEEIQEDIRQSKKHEKERMAAAKKAHKDKGKAVDTSQPKKRLQSLSQEPKEKLLSSSIAAERSFRESQNDGGKRKREREAMNVPAPPSQKHLKIILTPPSKKQQSRTPPPPPRRTPDPVEETSSEEEESGSDGDEGGARVAEAEEERKDVKPWSDVELAVFL